MNASFGFGVGLLFGAALTACDLFGGTDQATTLAILLTLGFINTLVGLADMVRP